MDPDKFQQAWQSQASQTRVTVDADLLWKEVQRNQQVFRTIIFWRDFREIGVALVMVPLWFCMGFAISLPWTWYLTVPALVWIAGFMLVYRKRHAQQATGPDVSLRECASRSLTEVENQIWLLRNVHWWYLLPPGISIVIFFVDVSWRMGAQTGHWLFALASGVFLCQFLIGIYTVLYYVNQYAVRTELEPRRQELLTLLADLGGDESTDEDATMNHTQSGTITKALRQWLIVAAVGLVTFAGMAYARGFLKSKDEPPPQKKGPTGDSLADLISELRHKKKLVGLAALVMVDGEIKATAADGERKKGSGVAIDLGDRWHLGSITKSVTATMIARLIESGRMDWSDTVGDCFPDVPIHEDWKAVTLRQLLTHTAGAPANFSFAVALNRPPIGPECTEERRKAVKIVIGNKPAHPPGKKFAYSNVGYTIAGAMAEKKTGATWDDLVKRAVFEPLGLAEAGFGPPKSSDKTLEQPRGHQVLLGWKIPADDQADNTSIIGPAGIVHMSLLDLCTYTTEHLRGELGQGKLLSAETYQKLHAPELKDYACGWVKKEPLTKGGPVLYWHNGSNTMWYALTVFIPDKNMVVAVTSNDGDIKNAEAAAWEVVKVYVPDLDALEFLPSETFAKKSPFAAVRWQESQPEVKVGDEWFKLVTLNDIAASEIIAFSQRTYGDKWQKRFEEDLVELLTRMGHPPQDKVTLVVQPLSSSETRSLKDIPMTEANRRAIYEAALARQRAK